MKYYISFRFALRSPIFKNGIRIVPENSELSDNSSLWRYMRLSTFLMLLRGKAFVPTITELRGADPVEANHRCEKTRSYFDSLPEPDLRWLLERANPREKAIVNASTTDFRQKARIFMGIWDRNLAERRRVWCWHHADIESMALWHIYAQEGVAVRTTPARLKAAFSEFFVDAAIIGSVHYIEEARKEAQSYHFMRPYLFKQRCYQHEREVRVIFPRNPDDLEERRLLPVDPKVLIAEVRIAPHMPKSEAMEVRHSLIHAWRNGSHWEEHDDDPEIWVSDTKTVFESESGKSLPHDIEKTGSTNFGSLDLPFVICGDFSY